MKKIKDAKPQVGIFELLDDRLYFMTQDMNKSDAVGGAVDAGNLFHRDLCKQILSTGVLSKDTQNNINKGGPFWLRFPRGRVWYSVPEDTYYISSCKQIVTNSDLVNDIISVFSLPKNKTQPLIDSDYNF